MSIVSFLWLFQLIIVSSFFERYSSYLPILDLRTTPNTFFSHSPFLFWAIVGVACRSYTAKPNLFATISPLIIDLALQSANANSRPKYSIQGILLTLTWPLTRTSYSLDTTYSLAAILMHSAKQAGFHTPRSSHEFLFSRDKNVRLTETEMTARSDLWARSVLVYQR